MVTMIKQMCFLQKRNLERQTEDETSLKKKQTTAKKTSVRSKQQSKAKLFIFYEEINKGLMNSKWTSVCFNLQTTQSEKALKGLEKVKRA